MYTKKIKFEDFNGQEREQTFYFNLNKAELTEMNLSKQGGLQEYVNRIVNTNNVPELSELFKSLILKSYGEKSDDGMRFVKKAPDGHRLADDFEQTAAYAEFFMELATNTDAATEFLNGIVPRDISEQAQAQIKQSGHAYPPSVMK